MGFVVIRGFLSLIGEVWAFVQFHCCLLFRREIKQLLSELDEEKKIRLRLQVGPLGSCCLVRGSVGSGGQHQGLILKLNDCYVSADLGVLPMALFLELDRLSSHPLLGSRKFWGRETLGNMPPILIWNLPETYPLGRPPSPPHPPVSRSLFQYLDFILLLLPDAHVSPARASEPCPPPASDPIQPLPNGQRETSSFHPVGALGGN